jgi:hypothetical protein
MTHARQTIGLTVCSGRPAPKSETKAAIEIGHHGAAAGQNDSTVLERSGGRGSAAGAPRRPDYD